VRSGLERRFRSSTGSAGSLISFHLTTETITLRGSPPVLPKLQRFRLESSTHLLDIISFESWQLPSLQYLEATLPAQETHNRKLATAFGAQLRSLSSLHSRYLTSNAFWENFPDFDIITRALSLVGDRSASHSSSDARTGARYAKELLTHLVAA
jgi:hypothetical protein